MKIAKKAVKLADAFKVRHGDSFRLRSVKYPVSNNLEHKG